MTERIGSYEDALTHARASGELESTYLRRELPIRFLAEYRLMSTRATDLIMFTYDTFDYWFDAYQDTEPYDPTSREPPVEARLVVAIGLSKAKHSKRDDYRLRGLTLSAMAEADGLWDRGHFIGHSIGGTVDGNEANVFLQLRSSNRGRYRSMESYCRKHPGVLCFSRPIYVDASAHPSQVEFGILKPDGDLWVEVLANRPEA